MNHLLWKYKNYQKRKSVDLPNKCVICGLRIKYRNDDDEAKGVLKKAEVLAEVGLAVSPPKNTHVTPGGVPEVNVTYFCALSNIKYWNQKQKNCPDFQLKLPDSSLTLSDYLAVHHSRNNSRIAFKLGIVAAVITIIVIIVSIIA